MIPATIPGAIPRRLEAAFAALLLLTFAWFHHAVPGWNVNTRWALTNALVDRGTIRIDDYAKTEEFGTGDLAVKDGHLYCDKPPGTSLLGVPALAAARGLERLTAAAGARPWLPGGRRWFVTVFSVGLTAAACGVLLARLLTLHGTRPAGALALAALTMMATPLFYYGTLFMAYAPAACFAMLAVWLWERWRIETIEPSDNASAGPGDAAAPPWFACGLALGVAMCCELVTAWVALAFAAHAAFTARAAGRLSPAGPVRFGAGAALGLAPFAAYCVAAFGALTVPYQYEQDELFRANMARGLMGATWPRLDVLVLLTVHPYRGLFVHAPWLAAGMVGWVVAWRDAGHPTRPARFGRAEVVFGAAVFAGILTYNSAYFMWWGGWSFAPRLLIPAIPFLALGAGAAWRLCGRAGVAARWAIGTGGAVAVAIHWVVNATEPQGRDLITQPRHLTMMFHRLMQPDLSAYPYPWTFFGREWPKFAAGLTDTSLGTAVLGLPGGWIAYTPLAALWVAFAAWVFRGPVPPAETRDNSAVES